MITHPEKKKSGLSNCGVSLAQFLSTGRGQIHNCSTWPLRIWGLKNSAGFTTHFRHHILSCFTINTWAFWRSAHFSPSEFSKKIDMRPFEAQPNPIHQSSPIFRLCPATSQRIRSGIHVWNIFQPFFQKHPGENEKTVGHIRYSRGSNNNNIDIHPWKLNIESW